MPQKGKRLSISAKFKRIIEELPIVNFLADHGHEPVRQEGSEQVYLCPFHDESRPSFKVNPAKHCFHCFGCKAGEGLGQDIIGLAILIYQIENGNRSDRRVEAAKRLWTDYFDSDADDKPATATNEPPARKEAESAPDPNVFNKRFNHSLKSVSDDEARDYCRERGIRDETQEHFGITYCTTRYFEGHLVIPLHDHTGMPIGYIGRALDPTADPTWRFPPEFKRDAVVFNLNRIGEERREVILVEGVFDVLNVHQLGLTNVVATLGSHMSDVQADLITERFDYVHILFDGDLAGESGANTAREKLRERNVLTRKLVCPEGRDPAELALDDLITIFGEATVDRLSGNRTEEGVSA